MTLNPTVLTYADLKTSIETVNDSPAPQVSVEPPDTETIWRKRASITFVPGY